MVLEIEPGAVLQARPRRGFGLVEHLDQDSWKQSRANLP
jgi:hypothetical protein